VRYPRGSARQRAIPSAIGWVRLASVRGSVRTGTKRQISNARAFLIRQDDAASRHFFCDIFFPKNTSRAIVHHRPIRIGTDNGQALQQIPSPRGGRLPAGRCVSRPAPRDRGSPAADDGARRRPYRASRGLGVQRIPRIIAEMRASRETDRPAGFVSLPIARISEAMNVAAGAGRRGDGQVHRTSAATIGSRENLTARGSRPEMAPQRVEKIESAPGNGMGSEPSKPQDVVDERAPDRALRPTKGWDGSGVRGKLFLPANP
jgi:hypothetical protein